MARPTDYNPTYVNLAYDYMNSCGREATELPTIEGLSLVLGCDDDQINEWSKRYPEFHAAIVDLKKKQKNQLINDGMYGGKEVNSPMAIFLLKANHGLKETTVTEIGGAKNDDGSTNPIYLYAAGGFVPASVTLPPTPATSFGNTALPESPEIQSPDMASEGEENIHSNNGNIQAGTS